MGDLWTFMEKNEHKSHECTNTAYSGAAILHEWTRKAACSAAGILQGLSGIDREWSENTIHLNKTSTEARSMRRPDGLMCEHT